MSEPRKKPGVAFWASMVMVGLLAIAAYPLSYGPVCAYLGSRGITPVCSERFRTFYGPLHFVAGKNPKLAHAINLYRIYCEMRYP